MEIDDQLGFVDDIDVEEVDADDRVEISIPVILLIRHLRSFISRESDFWQVPNVVVEVE